MEKLFLIAGILCFISNIYSQTTYTANTGTFSNNSESTDYIIQPTGALKVEITFTVLDFADTEGGAIYVFDGTGMQNTLITFDQDNHNAPVTVTSTTNSIYIMVDWWQGGSPWFTATYKGITPNWAANGSNIFFNNGNVGIGTALPNFPLSIESARGNTNAKFGLNAPLYMVSNAPNIGFNAYYESGWKFGKSTAASYGGFLNFDQTSGKFSFYSSTTAGSEGGTLIANNIMTLTRDGKLGLGTGGTAPINKLTIQQASNVASEGIKIQGGSYSWYLYMNSNNNLAIKNGSNTVTINQSVAYPNLSIGDYFGTGSTSLNFGISASYNGYSTIQAIKAKTSEPGGVLAINPEGGNVGIGTTAPNANLHIKSATSHAYIAIDKANSSSEAGIQFRTANNVDFYMFTDNTDNSALKIQANGLADEADDKPRIMIPKDNKNLYLALSGGSVGIGTKTPNSNLTVNVPASSSPIEALTIDVQSFGTTANAEASHFLRVRDIGANTTFFSIRGDGHIGIGTEPNHHRLNIDGSIRAKEVKINTTGADFVFETDYKLRTLTEVEAFIKQNKHLPDVAPAAEMQAEGANIGEMQTKLLQKVEELTLYLLEQKKTDENLQKQIQNLIQENEKLKAELANLK